MNLIKPLLIEIRTEELPPAQLWKLADSFPDSLLAALQKEGFADSESARAHNKKGDNKKLATPRRLAAQLSNISAELSPQEIVRRGPQIAACKDAEGAPTKALIGFMQSVGATCENDLTTVTEKGKEYIAWHGKSAARKLADELATIIERVLLSLPAPRLMRWGVNDFKFIRPVRGVLLLHGTEYINGNVMGISATKTTKGHPFLSKGDIEIADVDSYIDALRGNQVIVNMDERLKIIADKMEELANPYGGFKYDESSFENESKEIKVQCEFLVLGDRVEPYAALSKIQSKISVLDIDKTKMQKKISPINNYAIVSHKNELLREVCAMCEFPIVHPKILDERFRNLPWQCITECMQKHQRFIPMIPVGYEVTCQRDSDYKKSDCELLEWHTKSLYFIVSDNAPSDSSSEAVMLRNYDTVLSARLNDVLFYYNKDKETPQHVYSEKLKNIIFYKKLGNQHDRIGRVYEISAKIKGKFDNEDRMKSDAFQASLPTQMVGEYPNLQAVMSSEYFNQPEEDMREFSILYGLEKMVGLFGVGEKPTGSRDPHGLRQEAMNFVEYHFVFDSPKNTRDAIRVAVQSFSGKIGNVTEDVYDFCSDRFRVFLSQYARLPNRDLQDAVLLKKPDSFMEAYKKINALNRFMSEPECGKLAAANKRINNILRKSKINSADSPSLNSELFLEDAERELFDKLNETKKKIELIGKAEWTANFLSILHETATLAPTVDAFFEKVLVNHEDEKIRLNRFALLAELRDLLNTVGDLSYLAK